MPRPKSIPSYCLHKPSGRARVILDGKQIYLGRFGSQESREAYARLIAERFRTGLKGDNVNLAPGAGAMDRDLSVNELALKYITFAEAYYVRDGEPTGEVDNIKDALRSLRALYGLSRAPEFGPRAMKHVRQLMIDQQKLCRGVINGRVDRLKRMFKWAVSEELVPPAVYEGLRTVSGLRFGRSNAREAEPVTPVSDADVNATLKFLPPTVADMVRLQRITGMRSDNLVMLRPCDLDRSADVWVYEPRRHKTQHHRRKLLVLIGPKARMILEPYLTNRPPGAYCFSPIEVAAWLLAQRKTKSSNRKTPVYRSEILRLQRDQLARRRRKRNRAPGDRYTPKSYRRAVSYAIQKATKTGLQISSWHPHQLRHTMATEVRRQYGLEGAQLALGHSKANITEVYAERDLEFAKRIARKTG